MIRKLMLAVPLALTLAGAAHAEVPTSRTAIMPPSSKGGEVRVQVRITFFVPGTVDDGEASFKAQEQARRRLYESAARECDVLRATIAAECRVESININTNRQYGGRAGEGFNVSGNFAFRVTLK